MSPTAPCLIEQVSPRDGIPARRVRVRVLGVLDALPETVRTAAEAAMEATMHHDGGVLNICLAYSSRHDLGRAAAELRRDRAKGEATLGRWRSMERGVGRGGESEEGRSGESEKGRSGGSEEGRSMESGVGTSRESGDGGAARPNEGTQEDADGKRGTTGGAGVLRTRGSGGPEGTGGGERGGTRRSEVGTKEGSSAWAGVRGSEEGSVAKAGPRGWEAGRGDVCPDDIARRLSTAQVWAMHSKGRHIVTRKPLSPPSDHHLEPPRDLLATR